MSGFGKDGKGVILQFVVTQALGTLAALTPIIVGTKPALVTRFRILKAELVATVIGLTGGEGDGLVLYLVDGQYDIAEINAMIENGLPLGPNDSVLGETALRFNKRMGVTSHEISNEAIFHGKQNSPIMEETVRWTFEKAESMNLVVYNMGVVLTTGATVQIAVKYFGVWVT